MALCKVSVHHKEHQLIVFCCWGKVKRLRFFCGTVSGQLLYFLDYQVKKQQVITLQLLIPCTPVEHNKKNSWKYEKILTLKAPSRHFQIFLFFRKKNKFWHFMWIDCHATIHMQCQDLFHWKRKKKIECRLPQILLGTLRANSHVICCLGMIYCWATELKTKNLPDLHGRRTIYSNNLFV